MLAVPGGIAFGVATFFDLTMPWLIVMLLGGSAVVLAVLYRTTPEFFAPGFTDDGAKGVMRLAIGLGAVGVTVGGLSYIPTTYGFLPGLYLVAGMFAIRAAIRGYRYLKSQYFGPQE